MATATEDNWSLVIEPRSKWWDLRLKEIWDYRDLIWIFVRRDIVSVYKQTILGPLWFFLSPLFTVIAYSFVFGGIAGMSTDGIPAPVFYLAGTTIWNYFSACFTATSNTFTSNAAIFGKVYFPRMVAPIATVLSNLFKFFIQLLMLVSAIGYYNIYLDMPVGISKYMVLFPFLVLLMSGLALGVGIIFSSMTTKYRDLRNFIGFGVMILMYVSPVIYPVSAVPEVYSWFLKINPLTPVIETFRLAFTGSGTFSASGLAYSSVVTFVLLFLGIVIFHKVERTFMDTV